MYSIVTDWLSILQGQVWSLHHSDVVPTLLCLWINKKKKIKKKETNKNNQKKQNSMLFLATLQEMTLSLLCLCDLSFIKLFNSHLGYKSTLTRATRPLSVQEPTNSSFIECCEEEHRPFSSHFTLFLLGKWKLTEPCTERMAFPPWYFRHQVFYLTDAISVHREFSTSALVQMLQTEVFPK